MKIRLFTLLGLAFLIFPSIAAAHAFGQQFTLPLPVNFYIQGGMLAFIASCVALLTCSAPRISEKRQFEFRLSYGRAFALTFGIFGIALSAIIIAVSLLGEQDYMLNPVPNLFWILFMLMFVYVSAIIGDLWPHIDPYKRITRLFVSESATETIPTWLPYVPPMFFYALLWLELLSPGWGAQPWILATLFFVYAAISIVMSKIYGLQTWFGSGDFFTKLFSTISKIAPVQFKRDTIAITVPGERLVYEQVTRAGTLLLILIMLGSTLFDGIEETGLWLNFLIAFDLTEVITAHYAKVVALFVIPVILFGFYYLAICGMKLLTRVSTSIPNLALRFGYALVPIAVAYHFAHYFSLILSQGQYFIAQISDPITRGWDLFGTANYDYNAGLIGADTVWYLQLGSIVLGHILAAIVAHRISQRIFRTKRQVILSQLPMLVLMVFYTAFGLWTLAQPFALGSG